MQLKLIQEAMKHRVQNDDLEASIEHVSRCFEATTEAIEDGLLGHDSDSCIIFEDDICCFG